MGANTNQGGRPAGTDANRTAAVTGAPVNSPGIVGPLPEDVTDEVAVYWTPAMTARARALGHTPKEIEDLQAYVDKGGIVIETAALVTDAKGIESYQTRYVREGDVVFNTADIEDRFDNNDGGVLCIKDGDPNMHYYWAPSNEGFGGGIVTTELLLKEYRPVMKLGTGGGLSTPRRVPGYDQPVIARGDLVLWSCPKESYMRRQLRDQRERDRQYEAIIGEPTQAAKDWAIDNGHIVNDGGFEHTGAERPSERLRGRDDDGGEDYDNINPSRTMALAAATARDMIESGGLSAAQKVERTFFGQPKCSEEQWERAFGRNRGR